MYSLKYDILSILCWLTEWVLVRNNISWSWRS